MTWGGKNILKPTKEKHERKQKRQTNWRIKPNIPCIPMSGLYFYAIFVKYIYSIKVAVIRKTSLRNFNSSDIFVRMKITG